MTAYLCSNGIYMTAGGSALLCPDDTGKLPPARIQPLKTERALQPDTIKRIEKEISSAGIIIR